MPPCRKVISPCRLKLTLAILQRTLARMPTANNRITSNASDVVEKLQRSRKRLLDLTLRNRLLNFRPGNPNYQDDQKAHKHLVLDGEIEHLWQYLVDQEKQIEVACLTNDQRELIAEELQSGSDSSSSPEDGLSISKLSHEEWENVRDSLRGMAQFRSKGNLLSKLSSEAFRKRLTKIRNEQKYPPDEPHQIKVAKHCFIDTERHRDVRRQTSYRPR